MAGRASDSQRLGVAHMATEARPSPELLPLGQEAERAPQHPCSRPLWGHRQDGGPRTAAKNWLAAPADTRSQRLERRRRHVGRARGNTRARWRLPHGPHLAASGAGVASPHVGRESPGLGRAPSPPTEIGEAQLEGRGTGRGVEVGAWGGATSGLRTRREDTGNRQGPAAPGRRLRRRTGLWVAAEVTVSADCLAAAESTGGTRRPCEAGHATLPGPRLACCLDPVTFLDCKSKYENASALSRDSLT